ncbi:hypothetical protein ABZT34_37075 [Streptomyces sp. NPDC005329]|uniref:hypothetical protein n=1 Tax=Streptomyces sp. NPDC005329 TaxID=3157034 RepID=UPI0033A81CA9
MSYEDRAVIALETVAGRERAAGHGWALDWDLRPFKQWVFTLAERGLTELADREDRAALSAWEGRPVRRAARLTPQGHDLQPRRPPHPQLRPLGGDLHPVPAREPHPGPSRPAAG